MGNNSCSSILRGMVRKTNSFEKLKLLPSTIRVIAVFSCSVFAGGCVENLPINSKALQMSPLVIQTSTQSRPQGEITDRAANGIASPATTASVNAGGVNGDPTGLVGKKITPSTPPKGSDTRQRAYGNDYFDCGGAMVGAANSNISISILRKGMKTKCQVGKFPLAITRHSNNNTTHEFTDIIEVIVPKGYELSVANCRGAQLAISKLENKSVLTNHIKAWSIVDNKFSAITNTTNVKCENLSYGI